MNEIQPMLNYFPLAEPRSKQVLALERTMFHATNGIQDIVIAAPTGIGKTTIGAAACLWASQPGLDPKFAPGGFYLSTQKMLQDQLEKDFPRFTLLGDQCASLKSAVEYPCPRYTNCMVGRKVPKSATCDLVERGCCRYIQARVKFGRALLAATNYAYFFTERTYLGALAPRRVLVADECHTLERQLMSFVEFSVDKMALEKWAPGLDVPVLTTVEAFVDWVKKHYLAVVINRMEMLSQRLCENHEDARLHDEFNKLESHVNKVKSSIVNILEHPTDWVYWQQTNGPHRECIARPLFVRNYVKPLVTSAAKLRVYMSAYPGPKKIFCRSLGLDPDKTAWLNLNSTFPPANRPVHILSIGSMGRKNIDQTLPKVLRVTEKLLNLHATEKGIIHCHSYALGTALFNHLKSTEHARRILFARKSSERATCLRTHTESAQPTVLLSPSMSEGFSLDDDLARFQLITKMPYPYLGDQQIAARKDIDPEWYILQTVSTVIQAAGRIVRSDTDHGSTYILDSDFIRLFEDNGKFFPKWFRDAFKFY